MATPDYFFRMIDDREAEQWCVRHGMAKSDDTDHVHGNTLIWLCYCFYAGKLADNSVDRAIGGRFNCNNGSRPIWQVKCSPQVSRFDYSLTIYRLL